MRSAQCFTSKLPILSVGFAILFSLSLAANQAHAQQFPRPTLINQRIDENKLVTLVGNTRPEANANNDRGRVADDFSMPGMLLQLKRAPELEEAFDRYIDSLSDKSSPNFHRWLTAQQQGERYGVADADIDTITAWLESHGFTVHGAYPNKMVIAFSGNAGEIRQAFHTEIHNLDVNGERHFANMSDPQIPAALAPAIVGVVSMHNFKPEPMVRKVPDYTFTNTSGTFYALVPADFQTIYNVNPLFRLGYLGQGQTIAVVEDTDTYSTDVATYRSTFLSSYTGTVTTVHPTGTATCTDPGTNGDDIEADLDAEVAGAMAPDATIEVASCASGTSDGVLYAIQNLVNSATPPPIISVSYGECEAFNGASANAAYASAYQTGATAGVSIFVSSGDEGASACGRLFTNGPYYTQADIGITGWGESIYNVSVGGTDYEDTYNAKEVGTPISTYWYSTNTATYGSAKSYIPEIPWNDSCAGVLLANYETGSFVTYGSTGFCNVAPGNSKTGFLTTGAASGGPSNCATGGGATAQTSAARVSGSCAGYSKPSWQSGVFGNPADGVRDIPDVSMFASNGLWGHYTIECDSDTANGGTACTAGNPSVWTGIGGTSVAAPLMASLQALVNQKWGKQGNPNPVYYSIANSEFGSSGNSACYAINLPARRGETSSCVFNDVTQGDIDIPCRANGSTYHEGCYLPSGTNGVLSTGTLTTGTVISGGSGYTTAPTCTIGAPSNANSYKSPTATTLWAGGVQATCTASINTTTHVVSSITVTNSTTNTGYAGGASCTLTGGGGTGATCSVSPTLATYSASYQPAYGSTPGWDFATGLGTVNAYNLVMNTTW